MPAPRSRKPTAVCRSIDKLESSAAGRVILLTMSGDVRKLIFISFRDAAPDSDLARALAEDLSGEHDVFCSLNLPAGAEWGLAIEKALRRADVFLVIISEALLAHSTMVLGEIEKAVRRREETGLPLIIP